MKTRRNTLALFDRWSDSYDSEFLQRFTYRPLHDAVLSELAETNPATVLDLGCGTGQLLTRLTEGFPDADVTGLDYSPAMLSKARSDVKIDNLTEDRDFEQLVRARLTLALRAQQEKPISAAGRALFAKLEIFALSKPVLVNDDETKLAVTVKSKSS